MTDGQKRRSAAANLSAEESGESGMRHRVNHYTPHGLERGRGRDTLSPQHRVSRKERAQPIEIPLGVCEGAGGGGGGRWEGRTRTHTADSEGERGRVAPCKGGGRERGRHGPAPVGPRVPAGTGRALGEPRKPRRDSGPHGGSRNGAGRQSEPQRGYATRRGGGGAKRRGSPAPPPSPPSKASGERGGGDCTGKPNALSSRMENPRA